MQIRCFHKLIFKSQEALSYNRLMINITVGCHWMKNKLYTQMMIISMVTYSLCDKLDKLMKWRSIDLIIINYYILVTVCIDS